MDKKAEMTFNTIILAFYRFIVLFLVAITMVLLVAHFMKMSLDVFDIESEVFIQGLLNSPNGVSYRDGSRVYPGIVEYSSFRDKNALKSKLASGFSFGSKSPIAAKIELLSGKERYRSSEAVYYNEDQFGLWYPLGKTLFPGPGGAQVREKLYPVLVKDGTTYEQAILKITVAIPNS